MFEPQYLTCPIVRPARSEDAEKITEVIFRSRSDIIDSVYGNNIAGARKLLVSQFRKYNNGVMVLQEGEEIIGVIKLHLPGVKMGKTVSLLSLMRSLGIISGLKAALLLSNWDEYKLSPGEAYVEYIYIHEDWRGLGCEKILYNRAQELAIKSNASYLTKYIALRDYIGIAQVEKLSFISRRKIHSPIAKLLGQNGTWRKYTFTLIDGPITVKEFVTEKIQFIKQRWQDRRRESIAALRTSMIMTSIPVVGGTLAYLRGYPNAAIGWSILFSFHIVGGIFLIRDIFIGKYFVSIAMVSESVNFIMRAISTQNWFDRGWLLPVALINLWVFMSLIKYPSRKELIRMIDDSSIVHS